MCSFHLSPKQSRTSAFFGIPLIAGVLYLTTVTFAAPLVWDGDTSTEFTNGGNWIGGVTPANNLTTDSITFNSAPVTYQPSLNTTHSVLGVTLTGGTTFSGSGTLIVGASGMSATGSNTITLSKIQLGSNSTFSLAATTTLVGGIDTAGSDLTVTTASTTGLNLSNVVLSGTGKVTFDAGDDSRLITIGDSNTNTGTVAVRSTTVRFRNLTNAGSDGSFGSGSGDVLLDGGASKAIITNIGTGGSTNRLFRSDGAGTVEIHNDGTGAIHFNNTGDFGALPLTLSGTYTGATNTFASRITGSPTTSLTKLGAATWYLSATNSSFTGNVHIKEGVLIVASLANGGSNSSLGAGPNSAGKLNFTGGTLRYEGTTAQSTDRLFTINTDGGTLDASGTGVGTLRFTNTGIISSGAGAGSRILTLTGTNTGANLLAGALSNSSGGGALNIVKSGSGQWILSGNNAYTGTTTVTGGTLLINGNQTAANGAVTVGNGASLNGTLGGIGTIGGNTTIQSGSTLSPGDPASAGGVGTLSFNGDLHSASGSTWLIDLVAGISGSSDLVSVAGNLDFGGTNLSMNFTGTYEFGKVYTIASYGTLSGSFHNLSEGAFVDPSQLYTISYGARTSAGAITLTAVPEPGTVGFLLLFSLVFLGRKFHSFRLAQDNI